MAREQLFSLSATLGVSKTGWQSERIKTMQVAPGRQNLRRPEYVTAFHRLNKSADLFSR